MISRRLVRFVLSPALVFVFASHALAAFTCSTVARRGTTDPDGHVFGNKFHAEADTNAAGDTLFTARPNKYVDGLYLYPAVGADEIVARALSPAVGVTYFRTGRPFTRISINDAQDIGFRGRLTGGGYMVVVREAGGALESAAQTGDAVPAPAVGTYTGFPWVSAINGSSVIAFVGEVSGGPDGVFLYDASIDTASAGVLEGDFTALGREICDIKQVSLGDSGAYVFHASTALDCSDILETPLDGMFLVDGGAPIRIALEGDATAIPGTTYASFPKVTAKHAADPQINASNDVAFVAKVTGAVSKTVLFVWDFVGMTAVEVAATADLAPGPQAGTFKTLNDYAITDGGQVFLNAKLGNSPGKTGVFEFDGPSAAITRLDTPPTDLFGVGARYKKINKVNGVASDGSHIAIGVKVKDTTAPKGKAGVLNCVP